MKKGIPTQEKLPEQNEKNSLTESKSTDESPDMTKEVITTTGAQAEKETSPTSEGQAAKKKTQTQDKSPGDNGTKVIKTATDTKRKTTAKRSSSRVDSSAMTKNITTIGAQEQSNAKYAVGGARPKTPATPAKSPLEKVEDINEIKINDRKEEGVGACETQESPIKEVALDKDMKKLCLKETKKADFDKKTDPSTILKETLGRLKIAMSDKSKASEVINKIEDTILGYLKNNTICFKQVHPPLHTGSYYENVKISNPDEFDIMFPIPVDSVEINPFRDDGAFYSVSLKSRRYNPLQKFVSESKLLPASEILKEFREEVKKSISTFPGVKIGVKKKGCPAVTLNVEVDSRLISVDIVLCLVVQSSWPSFTKGGLNIEGWLGRKVKQKYKWVPYYLVPKYEGKGTNESNGVLAKDAWRVSFSHVEKDILKNHGSEKTCCEKDGARCCRKDCLKLLKHLLSLLKEQDKSFEKFCSYHVKTTLLHACCSRTKDTQWAAADLSQCFDQLLKDFEEHLERHQLNNFFIPTQNLLSGCTLKSCKNLAQLIKVQREKGFPIFN